MKAWVPVLIVLCLLFWQRCPSHWLAWLLVYPMHIWWSPLVDSLQYLYHCWVSRSLFSLFWEWMDVLFGNIFVFQFARHGKSWKNTIWWSTCLKYLLLLAKCWYTDTQFLEPGDVSRTSCAPFPYAMHFPNPCGPGGSGSASIFSAGFGNLIHNVPCFPFKELGVGRLNYLSFEKCSSRVLMNWRCWSIHLTQITIYLACVY